MGAVIEDTISTQAARRFYDRRGARHDWTEPWESRAKVRAVQLLDVAPRQRALNVGVGTGKDHSRLQAAVIPGGMAVGLDISPVMLDLTRARTGSPVCQGDARRLPFKDACFDRLLCTYVLDLIPAVDLPIVLAEFRRVVKPAGRMVLVTLTEGTTLPSRILIALWRTLYRLSPLVCGGCHPLQTAHLVQTAGFNDVRREVVVQLTVPSEVITAVKS